MIDTAAMRQLATAGGQLCSDGSVGIVVSTDWLRRAADELEAGRKAQASLERIDAHVADTLGISACRTL